jgi:hypothetical protein
MDYQYLNDFIDLRVEKAMRHHKFTSDETGWYILPSRIRILVWSGLKGRIRIWSKTKITEYPVMLCSSISAAKTMYIIVTLQEFFIHIQIHKYSLRPTVRFGCWCSSRVEAVTKTALRMCGCLEYQSITHSQLQPDDVTKPILPDPTFHSR